MRQSKHRFLNFLVERREELNYLLWAAMILKASSTLLQLIGGIRILHFLNTAGCVVDFVSGVVLVAFFIAELFLLPPWGLLLMLVLIGFAMFFIPYAVTVVASLLAGSLLLFLIALPVCYLLSGIIATFVGGVLTSIEVVTVTAPLTIAMGVGAGAAAAGSAVAYGTMAALDGAELIAYKGRMRRAILGILANLVIFTAIGWPLLSATKSVTGIMAFKPALMATQAALDHFNLAGSTSVSYDYKAYFDEEKEKNWVFGSNFYSQYINNGNNNITQGKTNRFAGNQTAMAVLLNGTLRVYDSEQTKGYVQVSYKPRETDALVLVGSEAFLFGHNKVLVCGSDGRYTWKKTKWTSEFEELSAQEQFERVYDILERQNTEEKLKFSYDEVGVVAYAQRNGLLLGYDAESHAAVFSSREENGDVTVYRQSGPGEREELGTFTPTYDPEGGLPYYADMNESVVIYLDEKQVKALSLDSWEEYDMFTHPEWDGGEVSLTSLHYGDVGEEGRYYIYLDDQTRRWTDPRLIGVENVYNADWEVAVTKISGFSGGYFYSFQYDDSSLLSKLTYLVDYKSKRDNGASWSELTYIWSEPWLYQRVLLQRSTYAPPTEQ